MLLVIQALANVAFFFFFFYINLGDLCESFMGKESPLLPTWGVEEFKVTQRECFII